MEKGTFPDIFHQTVRMADAIGVEPEKPRIAQRQQNRTNAPTESIEKHYLVNLAIPFTDHIISEMNARFSGKRYFNCCSFIVPVNK